MHVCFEVWLIFDSIEIGGIRGISPLETHRDTIRYRMLEAGQYEIVSEIEREIKINILLILSYHVKLR